MAKLIKLVCAQGSANDFVQASKKLGQRKLVKIIDMRVDIDLGVALADADKFEVCLTNQSQASMPGFNGHSVQWKKKITIAGAPAGAQEPEWHVTNLPSFEASEIFVQFDTDSRSSGADTCTFTIFYDDSRKAY